MAVITINEISRNYSYSVGTSNFATVALPITASWGPGYFDPDTLMNECREIDTSTNWTVENHSEMIDRTSWRRFSASQAGLEAFVSTYRGPVANYKLADDYSYQMAVTLLSAGYDILVCRLSPGAKSGSTFIVKGDTPVSNAYSRYVTVRAKYPGTFGNNLQVEFKNVGYMMNGSEGNTWAYYWNMIVYIIDTSGTKVAVENKNFVFNVDHSTNTVPHWREIESEFVDLNVVGNIPDFVVDGTSTARAYLVDINHTNNSFAVLAGGTDKGAIPNTPNDWQDESGDVTTLQKLNLLTDAKAWAALRYRWNNTADEDLNTGFTYATIERNYLLAFDYLLGNTTAVVEAVAAYMNIPSTDPRYAKLEELIGSFSLDTVDLAKIEAIRFREWIFTHAVGLLTRDGDYVGVYDLLKDKLSYNPQRIIAPGWDDQDFLYLFGADDVSLICSNAWGIRTTSPIHRKLMDVAYFSRCGTGMLDIPRSLDKRDVYDDSSENFLDWGYAQKLARYIPDNASFSSDVQLYHTHSALFTCWGRYTYAGAARQQQAPPAFLAILIQRAMILNQSLQYEWILPTDRKQNLNIGKLDYDIPQKLLNIWQTTEGVGVNCITRIPDMGTTLWGNSTLYEVPPATYQALANLSTRYLVNAIEDVVFKVGVGITFQYNNAEAYSTFIAGCLPILDTMRNAGAIEDYKIKMSMDINELDQVNANSVIGTVYIVPAGVVNTITIDLVALPPTTSLANF